MHIHTILNLGHYLLRGICLFYLWASIQRWAWQIRPVIIFSPGIVWLRWGWRNSNVGVTSGVNSSCSWSGSTRVTKIRPSGRMVSQGVSWYLCLGCCSMIVWLAAKFILNFFYGGFCFDILAKELHRVFC